MLPAKFTYDVRHVARVSCKCCAHLPREERATRDVTLYPSVEYFLTCALVSNTIMYIKLYLLKSVAPLSEIVLSDSSPGR
jgi:hypothetical protein